MFTISTHINEIQKMLETKLHKSRLDYREKLGIYSNLKRVAV